MAEILERRLLSLAVYSAIACTLMITPWLNFDPINLGKILVLSSVTFSGFFIMVFSSSWRKERLFRKVFLPYWAFILILHVPLIFASAPLSQQFWGVMGRGTGYLTYLSLAFLGLMIATTQKERAGIHTINLLLVSGTILSCYGIVQVLGLDPIKWSQFAVFGTLGNVNFFAAFLALVSIAALSLLFSRLFAGSLDQNVHPLLLFLLLLVTLFLNLKTDSMQGPITTLFGAYVALIVFAWTKTRIRGFHFTVLVLFLTSFLATPLIFGLLDKGPLKSILFQDSNVFRKDYMYAGLRMTLKEPFVGVGLDSYDNWYRQVRGFVAAFRTGPNRTSNTAHNIYLDLSSGGGIPLLLAYLSILLVAIYLSLKVLRHKNEINAYFVGIFSCFAAYHFQALLSINQIGLGVWGWLLTGALIAASIDKLGEINKGNESRKQKTLSKATIKSVKSSKKLPAFLSVAATLGFALGFSLGYLPLTADASFRKALNTGNLGNVVAAVEKPGSNAFLWSKAVQSAIDSRNFEVAKDLTRQLTKRYPREIYGWDVVYRSSDFSQIERNNALAALRSIDPNIFCYESDPVLSLDDAFNRLSIDGQGELLGWWGLVPRSGASANLIRTAKLGEGYRERIRSICR